jgi:hypothetical protein
MDKEKRENELKRTELLLAYLTIKDEPNLTEKVKILVRFGYTSSQISQICGSAKGSVKNARMKKNIGRKNANKR